MLSGTSCSGLQFSKYESTRYSQSFPFALHATSLIASCFDPLARSRKPSSEHQSEPTVFPRKCHSGECGRLFRPTIWFIVYLTTLFQKQELISEKSWRYDHEWKVGAILKAAAFDFFLKSAKKPSQLTHLRIMGGRVYLVHRICHGLLECCYKNDYS